MDPALVKYNNMMVNRHKYFRWTGRTARITLAYMVAFPAFMGYLAFTTDVSDIYGIKRMVLTNLQGKWNMRGKRRGDTIVEF
ncbi:hypothetical protein D0Z07_6253 [Hyphodiscus hymeniophilus]|uniref:Uncharacterized protein n=1 Tax=Hyphodiscus hymeniophilus TaxID=353542 RepID=A0A9P6VFV4_9HELO|nr:hypothetical protein D0Z07_6253 [Hyphodiscus hymeniophilus]